MCGIDAYIGNKPAMPILLDGLKRLEYRGYDSAGMSVMHHGTIHTRRQKGKIARLESLLQTSPLEGTIGIAHTRWATHGEPSEQNSHPHVTEKAAVIHNGIIENFQELKKTLEGKGAVFQTETDTEVIPHVIDDYLKQGLSVKEAVLAMTKLLQGSYACVVMSPEAPDQLIAVRQGSPMAIGFGKDFNMLSSDSVAIAPYTREVCYPEDGDVIVMSKTSVELFDSNGTPVTRQKKMLAPTSAIISKGEYRHFMLKEIHEQPTVIHESFHHYIAPSSESIRLPELPFDLRSVEHITIVACGTSYYAGMVAAYWLEQLVRIPVEVAIASEYRYRDVPFRKNGLVIGISQSGETADTLAALAFAKSHQQWILSIVNVTESSMARISDVVMPIFAGPEIGVASTKAFTAQLMTLAIWTLAMAEKKQTIPKENLSSLIKQLMLVPGRMAYALGQESAIAKTGMQLSQAQTILYVGRNSLYPIALEGALKLKELSYIHAEGIASGELKHGPIALIDDSVPIIALVPEDEMMFAKLFSNLQEIAARGGQIIPICQESQQEALSSISNHVITVPKSHPWVAPLICSIPIQLLAYYTALSKGTDVDQPRNLAKSVTVE